jgi:hypothetical protein
VAYQTLDGTHQEIAASYKILDAHTAAFTLGDYNRNEPLVIDPVLSYSTFYGGNFGETGWAIAVNQIDGSIYVAGQTHSTQFTNSIPFSKLGAYQTNYHGGKFNGDAFVARFDNSGTNLIYATYLGGSLDDAAFAIAVDNAGNAFIAGATLSTDFPVTNSLPGGNKISGVKDPNVGHYPADAFVAELNPSGSNLIYSTYIGGNSSEYAYGIALDETDNAFVTGFTYSTNYPVTTNAFQSHLACKNTFYINANAFVTEIAAGGNTLVYSSYLGGTNYDIGRAIAYNNGKVFVAGYTSSTNFPVTNSLPKQSFIYTNIAFATNGAVVQTNYAVWTNVFNGAFLNSSTNKYSSGASDVFVTAFNTSDLSKPIYSTFLGGTNNDQANGIAADADGNAYVTGYTCSTNFPNTVPNLASSYVFTNGLGYVIATNSFLTKIAWNGTQTSIGYSAMFGGQGVDVANGVALDPTGNAYVIGSASSTNFPVTTNNIGGNLSATNHYSSKSDVFVIAFNADASQLLYSAYIGGLDNDFGNAIAVDPIGNAYLTGLTLSTNFPTVNALQSHRNGTNDMFIAKISQSAPPAPILGINPQSFRLAVQNRTIKSLTPANRGITLQWQMFPSNYVVESSSDLSPNGWQSVTTSPNYSSGWYQLTLPSTNGVHFFRLRQR